MALRAAKTASVRTVQAPGAASARGAPFRRPCPPPHARKVNEDGAAASSGTADQIAEISSAADAAVATMLEAASEAGTTSADAIDDYQAGLAARVRRTRGKLEAGLVERDAESRLILLAALCGEHLLLLGPPGTAKSELARRLSSVSGGAYFERLLTRFSVPEELFGPLSMKGLEEDRYERQIDGYLPTAEVAFVDEIFKANSAILNALLTLLNERLFDNGNKRFDVPLLTLLGASNELPESEELDALYDRFLLRKHVNPVSANGLRDLAKLAATGFKQSLAPSDEDESAEPLSIDDFRACRDKAIEAVSLPDVVIDLLVKVRSHLVEKCEPPIYVSDRRFTKCVMLLQVAAYASGQRQVSVYDCLMLQHALGQRGGDGEKVRLQILDAISADPGIVQAELALLGAYGSAVRSCGPDGSAADRASAEASARSLAGLLAARRSGIAATLDGEFPLMRGSVWLSETDISSASQALSPPMRENLSKVDELLREALVISESLSAGAQAGVLEKLLPRRQKQFEKGIKAEGQMA